MVFPSLANRPLFHLPQTPSEVAKVEEYLAEVLRATGRMESAQEAMKRDIADVKAEQVAIRAEIAAVNAKIAADKQEAAPPLAWAARQRALVYWTAIAATGAFVTWAVTSGADWVKQRVHP